MKLRDSAITALLIVFAVITLTHPQLVSAQEPEQNPNSSQDSQEEATTSTGRTFRDWAGGIQSIVTVVAIGIGGYLAWRNWHIFRAREPHVTISHQVSHRVVGTEYVHISLTVTLHNSSRVHLEFRDGSFTLQQLAPVLDEEVERLYVQVFEDGPETYLQWPTLEDVNRTWNEDELVVEPGESEYQTYEFIVNREVESVVLSTYFYNSRVLGKIPDNVEPRHAQRRKRKFRRWLEERGPSGWGRTTVYDIILYDEDAVLRVDEGNGTDAKQEEDHNNQ